MKQDKIKHEARRVKTSLKRLHLGWPSHLAVFVVIITIIRFALTNPNSSGPFDHFVNFTMIYLSFLCSILAFRIWPSKKFPNLKELTPMLLSSMVFAFAPVFALALSSLNQLRILDVVLIIVVELLLYFYVKYQFGAKAK